MTGATGTFGFGLIPLPLPAGPAQFAARAVAALPFLPPNMQWGEAASHPATMDITRAKRDLGWAPRFITLKTLRDTLRPGSGSASSSGPISSGWALPSSGSDHDAVVPASAATVYSAGFCISGSGWPDSDGPASHPFRFCDPLGKWRAVAVR